MTTADKATPVGEVYLDAHETFRKKYRKRKGLLADVEELLNKLQIWDITVALNIAAESRLALYTKHD